MSGAAAAGGFAYQHAQAIQAAMRLAEEPDLARIRVEADNDAIDLEIWSVDDVLVEASQFKRRGEPYTWGQQELIDELADWSPLGVKHPDARYRFVTDGRLGPTGRGVRDALVTARSGDTSGLADLMQNADTEVDVGAVSRASVVVDDVTYNALIARAQDRAKALLPNVSSPAEAEERSRWVALELLHIVTDRSGRASSDERFINRTEVLELLSTPQDSLPTTAWATELKEAFLASVLSDTEVTKVDLPCIPDGAVADGSARLLEDWTSAITVCVVGGGTGSGKSTALAGMQYRMAKAGTVVLVADAEDYQPGRFAALMAAALNRHTHIGAHPAVGTAALKDPLVTVAIDGVSELAPATQDAMRSDIRAMLASAPRARLVVAGRDTTVLRSMMNTPSTRRRFPSARRPPRTATSTTARTSMCLTAKVVSCAHRNRVLPRLGVKDAYVLIRRGDVQTAVRFSDGIDNDRLNQNVNGYRLDVVEPLQELHLTVAETEGVSVDLRWRGLFPAALEQPHQMHSERRVTLQACRFAQLGNWEGWIDIDGDRLNVSRRPRWAAATGRGESGPSGSRNLPAGRTPHSAECGGCICRWPSTTTRSS